MRIESYSFGRIVIAGETFQSDVLIFPDRVKANWWRKQGHSLGMEDLEDLLAAHPKEIIVGTGAMGVMRVSDDLIQRLSQQGITLVPLKTGEACDRINQCPPDGDWVAGLHLTC